MHITESILDNLETTLAGIVNISSPIANSGNSSDVNNISVSSSGKYVSTASRSYTITITTSGESGIAECEIVDSLGTGSRSDVSIVSGLEINLGSFGAKIKFDLLPGAELILGDSWVVHCNHLYNTNIKKVNKAQLVPQEVTEFPAIMFAMERNSYDLQGSSSNYRCEMSVHIECWFKTHNSSTDALLTDALQDIERAISLDAFRGGNAQDTILTDSDFYLPVQGSPFAAVSVEISIWYNNIIN